MKRIALLSALLYCCTLIRAQDDTTGKDLDEVLIYTNKFAEKKKNIAQKTEVINTRNIARLNVQNTGDLLVATGNVFVQKSQQGGSSPVLRGFEASRVLLVVDGIRMNNAIYRAGHLQNVITLDQNMLERVEILYGPASTIYGSDALGGVVSVRSKSPQLHPDGSLASGSGFLRYSSANDEKSGHADLSLGGKKFGWLQSYTFSDFGDMKMGKNYPDKYPTFGRRDSLIAFFGFRDSVIVNPDPQVQRYSGYHQWDVLQKFLFKQSERISHTLNFQYSNSSRVPRYDRLQDKRNFGGSIGTTLRYAEWFYGPQERLLAAYELNATQLGPWNQGKLIISFQDIDETRHQREYRRYDRFDSRMENVKVWAYVADVRRFIGKHELTVGTDGQLNDVTSRARRTNLNTGAVSKLDTRYPDGKNRMNYFGIYAQHVFKMAEGKWILNDGLRLQAVTLRSEVLDNSFFNLPVTKFSQENLALTGNLGLIHMPKVATRIALNLSSGFRAPNIDDLVKVFDFSVARRIYVPNANIKPEYTYNADLSAGRLIAKKLRVDVNVFYTVFDNAIVSAPFQLNGEDSVLYNGIMTAVYANQNLNSGHLYGLSAQLQLDIAGGLTFLTTGSYTRGRLERFNGTEVPMDHIPPFYGKTSLSYQRTWFAGELYAMYNGWKRIADYNPDGEDNQQYATADGMPGWATLNLKASADLTKHLGVQLGIENILDRNYRYFASGFSAPGRNFVLTARFCW
ncbi:MAG TPA: TonB-dependent receptor [Chitinophagaceae bacterium]|nr:TonB-dependent receptor [Chitinophagaceae bacterium]